jgi:RNA polymerase primary sigma factor
LGLTATFERADDAIDEVLNPYFIGTCFRYGYAAARADGVIAPYSVLGIGVELEEATRAAYDDAGEAMAKARASLVRQFGYPETPADFLRRAQGARKLFDAEGRLARKYIKAMSERERILAESKEKMEAARLLAPAIGNSTSALVFAQRISSMHYLRDIFLEQNIATRAFHTARPDEELQDMLEDFGAREIKCLVSAQALDEGIDIPDADLGIVTAGSRRRRQMIQRMGRVVRRKQDGRGVAFIVLYARGTNEDPSVGRASDCFGELLDHADNAELWNMSDLASRDIGERILEWIWDPGPRASQ